MSDGEAVAFSALSTRGAAFLRGVLDEGLAGRIVERAEAAYAARAPSDDPYYQRQSILLETLVEDPAAVLPTVCVTVAARVLGGAAALASQAFVRRMPPGAEAPLLPFHQDETLLDRPCVNVWLALTACGREAPGLELGLDCLTRLAPAGGVDSPYPAERDQLAEAAVAEACGGFWTPEMEPGDGLMFLGTTPHRTHTTPAMTRTRLSVELRLIRA